MDGNGRWAQKQGLGRLEGHRQGAKTVEDLVRTAPALGLDTLTFYAFSSENWKRPEDEVSGLMELLKTYFTSKIDKLKENNIRLRVFGDKSRQGRLSEEVINIIENVEQETENCTGLNVNFCINYGGRDEIIRAAQDFADEVEKGLRFVGDLDEKLFAIERHHGGLVDRHVAVGVAEHGGRGRDGFHVEHELVRADVAGVDDGIDAGQRLVAQRLAIAALEIHTHEPLRRGAIDDRRLVAPTVHVAVGDRRVGHQRVHVTQLLDDVRVGFPDHLTAEERQVIRVNAVALHRI